MTEKYKEHQMYVKADENGKFAGAILVSRNLNNGQLNTEAIDKFIAEGGFPCTHGLDPEHNQHGDFLQDKIRYDKKTGKFYKYVKPEAEVKAEELALEKGKKLSIIEQNLAQTKDSFQEYMEGALTDEQYAPIKAKNNKWRAQRTAINACTTIEELNAIEVEKYVKTSA